MDNKDIVILAGSGQGGGPGMTEGLKQAFLNAFNHVAWTDEHGQDYVDALEAAFYPISYITAVYTQSGAVYDTDSLDSLKDDLVVTAFYQGGGSKTVTDYTLSGTLTEGTSTITVSYGGKTATFDVVVSALQVIVGYDSVGSPTITDNVFTPSTSGYIETPDVFAPGDSAWAIRTKVVASQTEANYQNLLRSVNTNNEGQKGIVVQRAQQGGGAHTFFASSDNSNYDISSAQVFYLYGTVFLEIAFDGVQTYTVKSSVDGESWNTLKTITSTKKVFGGFAIAFGGPNPSTVAPYGGNIYLDETKIYIDGQLWWKAVA